MSSPRKFAEKIALLQQKQAEGDAAFNSILYEVEAVKQKVDRAPSIKSELDVSKMPNGMNHSNDNRYSTQFVKSENTNVFDRLSLPSDNSSWRRTYSDSSLHQSTMPTMIAHYHPQHHNDDNIQQLNFNTNEMKIEPPSYSTHYLQVSNSQYQTQHPFDFNNNNNYTNDRATISCPPNLQQNLGSANSHSSQTLLGTRYNGGNMNSNVLMLPPNQNSRNGGSLPDLRLGSVYNNNHQSFSPTSTSSHCFRSLSPQQNGNEDLFMLEPQQQNQLTSNIGPVKQSSSMRRRHSPIGTVKSPSSRRHSPSPEVSSTQQSPQSQSSYSPQNSPHLLPSPNNEHSPFSPQQQQQQPGTDNQQPHYFTLSNHFDQITLDNNYYPQKPPSPQQQQQQQQQQHHHSLPATPADFQQGNFYSPFIDDMPPSYSQHQRTNTNVKSPTIPDIILTDVDSSKLDLSKDMNNDFTNPFDSLIDLQLSPDDLLLNSADLSIDQMFCDDNFRTER